MNSNKVLFISNRKYVDQNSSEGGVKLCTREYIDLLATAFEVLIFPVDLNLTFFYRVKKKLGVGVYDDYAPYIYLAQLENAITENSIQYVFLNLTNTIMFSEALKKAFPQVKVILCSHGNESGDFLHEIVMHENYRGLRKIIAQQALGKMLIIESTYRNYIDLVLTVSEVEVMIEKWIGAKEVKLVTRTIYDYTIPLHPIKGRIGFFADLSHAPNLYGIQKVCASLARLNPETIELRLVGAQKEAGNSLAKNYSFITYLGYLTEIELEREASTWMFALNPVFYYSRGVSTKLGKALSWGLPVISSRKGMRGYQWKKGDLLSCDTAEEMATIILLNSNDMTAYLYYKQQVEDIKLSSPSLKDIMNEVCVLLEKDPGN